MNWIQLLSSGRVGQPASSSIASRSAFEQDYDRIIFSHPFRKLQDKTQVHPLPEHDFVHTRLTHSLEVSSVGRSLGKRVGETILQRHAELKDFTLYDIGAIVAAASLAHDMGNPPFGHAGEDALSDFFRENAVWSAHVSPAQWEDLLHFEGNAQGFRLLNQSDYGLKLTAATLGAFTKYPCPAFMPARDKAKKSQKKFGYFDSERTVFAEVAGMLGLQQATAEAWCRHPLAFLVEAADDICYSIIDLEDGCRLGLVSFEDTIELLAPILGDKLDRQRIRDSHSLNRSLGTLRALAIGVLIDSTAEVFLDHEQEILQGTYDRSLADETTHQSALKQISRVSVDKIYHARQVTEIEAAGHVVLPGLLEAFVAAGTALRNGEKSRKNQNLVLLLPEETRWAVQQAPDSYGMLRAILDFVAGLTDRHALSLYRKMKGISLP